VIGGLLAASIAVGALVIWTVWGARAPRPAPSAQSPQMDALARAVVATQVEVARKKLEIGDYDEALRQAERAEKLDPSDAEVQKVLGEGRELKARVDAAVGDVRAASGGSDTERKASAYWRLLEVAPDIALAAELAPGLDPSFRPRAEEAQRLVTGAQKAAEKAQAARLPTFQEAASLVRSGDAAFRERRFAGAAREFMRARARFERAQRSAR
jgi:tetratricopeptide (TPR) repeat protein